MTRPAELSFLLQTVLIFLSSPGILDCIGLADIHRLPKEGYTDFCSLRIVEFRNAILRAWDPKRAGGEGILLIYSKVRNASVWTVVYEDS